MISFQTAQAVARHWELDFKVLRTDLDLQGSPERCLCRTAFEDAANLVGCVGMEHPSGLTGGLVLSFLAAMRRDAPVSTQSWKVFAGFVLALRFAWLAEWLRKKDSEMIELEIVYMHLLMKNMEALKQAWSLSTAG